MLNQKEIFFMGNVRRVYVEKKEPFNTGAKEITGELTGFLGVKGVKNVRLLVRYDIEDISDAVFEKALGTVFSEAPVDDVYLSNFKAGKDDTVISVEYLPGQFDQRADSAVQCVALLSDPKKDNVPVIRTAVTYIIEGKLTKKDVEKIKSYLINPVDQREASEEIPETLAMEFKEPEKVKTLEGFTELDRKGLEKLHKDLDLAMTADDLEHIYKYYKREEKRDPSFTEIKIFDTYWSDHCRHSTFLTELKNIKIGEGSYKSEFDDSLRQYMRDHKKIYGERKDKYLCLMDMATLAMKKMLKTGQLGDMEETDEVNACSIVVPVEVDGKEEEWLISFKNETHNHPTEIEPFGGAATCLGGAIRDPLSGRTYVYQAMRITGAADPTVSASKTLKGKLPQKKICTEAARGYSSYGNQVGLATGYVKEIYHPGYAAKRMEIGAVIGAAKRSDVLREAPKPGDVVVLLGGRTGRDGIGGATGSSKAHTAASVDECGAEVQKGNPPEERKMQRLFRRPEVTKLIKKCNDFGAGGVAVAVGELADGLDIDLDKIPKKYEGLDATELAISESQERMAVVLSSDNADEFIKYADEENLEATVIATVTKEKRLIMRSGGETVADISRDFLSTNGVHQVQDVEITIPDEKESLLVTPEIKDWKKAWIERISDLNSCSQRGLVERFDSTIGAGSVIAPYGGKEGSSEVQTMIHKIPVADGECDTVTMMSYGFDPYLSSWSPFHGASWAIVDSVAKIVASGGDCEKIRFSFQEYFGKPGKDPKKWGDAAAALIGAHQAQISFGMPAIGGKDSMSGSFEDIDVPPTLVSFAVCTAKEAEVLTPDIKHIGSYICKFEAHKDVNELPIYEQLLMTYSDIHRCIRDGVVTAAYALDNTGLVNALTKMAMGSGVGIKFDEHVTMRDLFDPTYGSLIVEIPADKMDYHFGRINMDKKIIGITTEDPVFDLNGQKLTLEKIKEAWEKPLESVYPVVSSENDDSDKKVNKAVFKADSVHVCSAKKAKPTVFIPVFPGTNCEYDTAKAFEAAGANVITEVFRNLTPDAVKESVAAFKKALDKANILAFAGGFSAGDEPDGAAKFAASVFRNEKLSESVAKLLDKRDGLILGVCNGFQTLIKLGLLPNGEISDLTKDSPTLTTNTIGRHIAKYVNVKVTSNLSPWLAGAENGGIYTTPVSHGEGRFVAPTKVINELFKNGQVATRYCAPDGNVYMDERYNVNGSFMAIEGITSADGRIYGKMAHPERFASGVGINVYGEQDMKIFESGVKYFK